MSTSLRIEELKKKFDENPRRYFAPLANEYRKAGDLQQAIAICQAHLPQQPGHMSGHIVYGQALFEARQFDQARTVFETALALDPENLIALRYLGDIAFELGDRGGARTWYTRVLETDPRNEEIAALMAAMGDERGAPTRDAAPPAPAAASAGTPTASPPPARPEPVAQAAAPPKEPAKEPAKAVESRPADKEAAREASEPASATDAELERLFARPTDRPAPATSAGASGPAAPTSPSGSFSPLSGFGAPPSDAPPTLEQRAPSLGGAAPESALARPTFDAQRGDDSPLQNPPTQPPPAATSPVPGFEATARDTGFVTETMAELYVKQGFHDRALDVYRQLIAQNPGDRALRERMERVEREVKGGAGARSGGSSGAAAPARVGVREAAPSGRGGLTIRQFLAEIGSRGVTGRGPGVAPPPGGGPRTSGELRIPSERPARPASAGSIDALFAGTAPSREDVAAASTLADAFPGGAGAGAAVPEGQIAGRPAHPAATELSLDHVFREGGGAVSSGRTTSVVSYDQFFSQPTPAAGPAAESAPAASTPAAGADDIEQFNAWLQGLKKR